MVRLGWSRRAYQVTAEHAGNGSRLPHIWLTVLPPGGGGVGIPPPHGTREWTLTVMISFSRCCFCEILHVVLRLENWLCEMCFCSGLRNHLLLLVIISWAVLCWERSAWSYREGSPMKPTLYTLISSVRFFTLISLIVWIFNKTMKQLFVSLFCFVRAKLIQRDLNY